jgi:hypothetical protein
MKNDTAKHNTPVNDKVFAPLQMSKNNHVELYLKGPWTEKDSTKNGKSG